MEQDTFAFLKHDEIGAAAAEDDALYLEDCFVDTGDLGLLTDCKSHKHIIVGRTGSGKSALIFELTRANQNVIPLRRTRFHGHMVKEQPTALHTVPD